MEKPILDDPRLMSIAAALVELLALRSGQDPPSWTSEVGSMPEPFFLFAWAETDLWMRQVCEEQAPEPLKKRLLYAPPNYLHFV